MNCPVLELTEELIRRESVTPNDAGCLNVLGARLERLGFQLETGFSGYDLGLVEPDNRTSVMESIPEDGSEDAKSFIAFEAVFSIQYGKNLDSLFMLPIMWFLLPAVGKTSSSEEE